MGNFEGNNKKKFINYLIMDPATATAMMIFSLGSGLFNQLKGAKANKDYQNRLNQFFAGKNSELQNWYDKNYNQNYLDNPESKAAIREVLNQVKTQNGIASNMGAITGASDDTRIGQMGESQRRFSDFINRLTGMGTNYKNMIDRMYMGRKDALDSAKVNSDAQLHAQEMQNYANAANNSFNLGGTAAMMGGSDTGSENWLKSLINLAKKGNYDPNKVVDLYPMG